MFDVLDDEVDISSLHHPTTKPQSKLQIIPYFHPDDKQSHSVELPWA